MRTAYDPDGLPLVPGLIEVITQDRARPASGTQPSPITSARSRSAPGGAPEGREPDERRRLDPRRELGAVPEGDLRHAGLPGLRLRSQHVQPRSRGGAHRVHGQPLLPGRSPTCAELGVPRHRPRARVRRSYCSGRPTTTPPTRPGSRASTAASIFRRRLRRSADRVEGREAGVGARRAVLRRHCPVAALAAGLDLAAPPPYRR